MTSQVDTVDLYQQAQDQTSHLRFREYISYTETKAGGNWARTTDFTVHAASI